MKYGPVPPEDEDGDDFGEDDEGPDTPEEPESDDDFGEDDQEPNQ